MNTPDEIDENTLMAYADGELDTAQSEQIEQLLQRNPIAAARVAQHRSLRAKLFTDLSSALSEPVPEHLANIVKRHAGNSQDNVVDLTQIRERKGADIGRWTRREWSAMAASLIIGVAIGVTALKFNSSQLVSEQGGALIARGELATALTTQLASANANQSVLIGISFRNRDGQYCRSFSVQDAHTMAGLACRSQGNWQVQMLTESTSVNSNDFRQASSGMPLAVLNLVERQIVGDPLDANAEIAARQSGWK